MHSRAKYKALEHRKRQEQRQFGKVILRQRLIVWGSAFIW
jgi:hypothetical protein